jgi:ABC-type dipeptide/oligopeptide/nickel transport system permease subunit
MTLKSLGLGRKVSSEPTVSRSRLDQQQTLAAKLWNVVRNPLGAVGAIVFLFVILAGIFGPLIWRVSYTSQNYVRLSPPSAANPMGTDELGRDVFSRVLHGAQVSLQVGAISVIIALVVGLVVGVLAAYFRGVLDLILMRLTDIAFAVPGLVLALLISGLLGPSRTNAMIAIGVVYAPTFARVIRSAALGVIPLPFVEASRALGGSSTWIMTKHVLGNVQGTLIVLCTIYMSGAILTEAALSFLGLGTQPPEPSWGTMLKDSMAYMQIAPWLAIFPGGAIMLTVLGLNFLGDSLRDTFDPKLHNVR